MIKDDKSFQYLWILIIENSTSLRVMWGLS